MHKILSLFLVIFLMSFSNLFAKTNSAVFLRINPSARISAMGGAGTAAFGDVSNIEVNPAALLWVEDAQIYFSHNKWFQDISMNYAAYAKPLGNARLWIVAVSAKQLSVDGLTERNEDGKKLGTFDASDTAYTLTATRKFSRSLAAGVTAKAITQEIYKESGSAYAGDAGVLWNINRFWNVGAAVRNVGNDLRVYKKAFQLPMTYSVGAGFHSPSKYHLGLDIEKEINCDPIYRTGIEYFVGGNFDIRAGYMYTADDYASDGFTLGFGFSAFYQIFIDYAFVPFGDLGDTHRVSLKYVFD